MATHSSILARKIPWTEEPGQLQSMRSQSQTRLSDDTSVCLFLTFQSYRTCLGISPPSIILMSILGLKKKKKTLLFHLPKTHNLKVCGGSRALIDGFKLIQKTQSIVPCHFRMTVSLLIPPHLAPSIPQLTPLHQCSPTFFEGDSITEGFIRVPSSWLFR